MDSKDHDERERSKNSICSLEWIALAMDAARRYTEAQQLGQRPRDDQVDRESQ